DRIILDSPEEAYDLVSLVGYGGCVVNRVFKKAGEHAASASYSGNGQILLARCGSGFPQADDFSKALGKAKLKAFYFSVKGGLISVEKKPDGTERPNEVSPGILARLKPRFSRIL
ncbi:MAG: hypothetical protein NTU61_04740, partial [Candidatus Altiarchaeota archaeon]|nr:hypothetical protein [Candidatus Altiarchaeota archaeon]